MFSFNNSGGKYDVEMEGRILFSWLLEGMTASVSEEWHCHLAVVNWLEVAVVGFALCGGRGEGDELANPWCTGASAETVVFGIYKCNLRESGFTADQVVAGVVGFDLNEGSSCLLFLWGVTRRSRATKPPFVVPVENQRAVLQPN